MSIRVELCFCPICGQHVEWQGNDYGYICNGRPGELHEEVNARSVEGTFTPDPESEMPTSEAA